MELVSKEVHGQGVRTQRPLAFSARSIRILAAESTTKVITNSRKPSANNVERWKSAASPNSLASVEAIEVPGEKRDVGMRLALPITKVTAMVSPRARPRP